MGDPYRPLSAPSARHYSIVVRVPTVTRNILQSFRMIVGTVGTVVTSKAPSLSCIVEHDVTTNVHQVTRYSREVFQRSSIMDLKQRKYHSLKIEELLSTSDKWKPSYLDSRKPKIGMNHYQFMIEG